MVVEFKDWPEVRAMLKPTLVLVADGIDVPLESFPIKAIYTPETLRGLKEPTTLILCSLLAETTDDPTKGFIIAILPIEYMGPAHEWAMKGCGGARAKLSKPTKDKLGKPVLEGPDGFAITPKKWEGYNILRLRRRIAA